VQLVASQGMSLFSTMMWSGSPLGTVGKARVNLIFPDLPPVRTGRLRSRQDQVDSRRAACVPAAYRTPGPPLPSRATCSRSCRIFCPLSLPVSSARTPGSSFDRSGLDRFQVAHAVSHARWCSGVLCRLVRPSALSRSLGRWSRIRSGPGWRCDDYFVGDRGPACDCGGRLAGM